MNFIASSYLNKIQFKLHLKDTYYVNGEFLM
jgi:hypothetical protein